MNTERNIAVAKDKFDNSNIGRMGFTPSMTTSRSTPSAVIPKVQSVPVPTVPAKEVTHGMSVKSNAQREAYERAMSSAYKAQKTFGVPGAK